MISVLQLEKPTVRNKRAIWNSISQAYFNNTLFLLQQETLIKVGSLWAIISILAVFFEWHYYVQILHEGCRLGD